MHRVNSCQQEPGKDNKSEVASPKHPQLKRTSDARVDNKKPSIAQQLEMLSKELNSEIDEEEAERDQQRLNVLTRAVYLTCHSSIQYLNC